MTTQTLPEDHVPAMMLIPCLKIVTVGKTNLLWRYQSPRLSSLNILFSKNDNANVTRRSCACNDADSLLEDCDCGENELAVAISKPESITAIHRNAVIHKKNLMSKFDTIRHLCVLRFLQKTLKHPPYRMTSSKQIAESIFGPEKGTDYKIELYPDME